MKKYLAITIAAIMTCIFAMAVYADEQAETSFMAVVEEKVALQGDVVEVNVRLQNNPGVLAMLLVLNYDVEFMELTDVKDGGLLAGPVFGEDYLVTPYKMLWNSASKVNFSEDGVLVTLVFKVKDNASSGMTDVTLSYKSKNVYDVDLNDVPLIVKNGGVFISASNEDTPSEPEIPDGDIDDEESFEDDEDEKDDSSKRKPSSSTVTATSPNKAENSKEESPEEDINPSDTFETDDDAEKREAEEDYQAFLMDYVDIKSNDWFYESVQFVSKNNLMNGMSEGCFAPQDSLTRAMFVTILYRIEGMPATAKSDFVDVEEDSWYEDSISWASINGIVKGVSKEKFAPYESITREQMATMIFRYFEHKGIGVNEFSTEVLSIYEDALMVSDYALDPFMYVCDNGIMKGVTESRIEPQGKVTRAQAATVFKRILENPKWGQLLFDKL